MLKNTFLIRAKFIIFTLVAFIMFHFEKSSYWEYLALITSPFLISFKVIALIRFVLLSNISLMFSSSSSVEDSTYDDILYKEAPNVLWSPNLRIGSAEV